MTVDLAALSHRLRSADADGVAAAMDDLHARLLALDTHPIPQPPTAIPDTLRAAAGTADIDDRLVRYLNVLAQYPFDPPLSDSDRVARSIETILRGGSYAARTLSLRLVASPDLVAALQYLGKRGVRSGREEDQAGWLLSYLLDDVPTRATTAGAVWSWPSDPVLDRVIASVPEGLAAAGRDRR